MTGQTILLLHGALGSADQLSPLADLLVSDFEVVNRTFLGHGGSEIPSGGFRMDRLVADLEEWMVNHLSHPVITFGFSMGGYAAMVLAIRRPELFTRIITLGTKWDWTPDSAAHEARMLDTNAIAEKAPALVELITRRHAPRDWKHIVHATIPLLTSLGEDPLINSAQLHALNLPVDILWGSADRMVSKEESERTAHSMPKGKFHVLEGVKHPFELVDPRILLSFFN